MFKCDRCGDTYEIVGRFYGISEQMFGVVEHYYYSDEPRTERMDLCPKCQGELDKTVREWWGK